MNTDKHTPGPWFSARQRDYPTWGAPDVIIAQEPDGFGHACYAVYFDGELQARDYTRRSAAAWAERALYFRARAALAKAGA